MKSNSFKERLSRCDFYSNLKVCAIISLCLVLIATVIFAIFNFNLSADFVGGKVADIKVGTVINNNDNYDSLSGEIKAIFSKEGFKITSIQKYGFDEDATIVVKFKGEGSESDLTSKLESNLTLNGNSVQAEVMGISTYSASIKKSTVIYSIVAVLTALIVVLIYLGIRYKLTASLTTLLIVVHDILLMSALVVLTRIEIGIGFVAGVFITLMLSLICSLLNLDRFKENKEREIYKEESEKTLANLTVRENFKKVMYILGCVLILLLLLLIFSSSSIRLFLLPIIIGILVVGYSSIMLTLPAYAYISKNSNKK